MQRTALAIYRESLGDDNQTVLSATVELARLLTARGEHAAAADLLVRRRDWLALRPAPDPAEEVKLLQETSSVYRAWGRVAEAREWTGRARAIQRVALMKELDRATQEVRQNAEDGAAWAARAKFAARAGQFQQAADDYARATRLGVSDHWAWYVRAALLAYLDRAPAYEAHCHEMRARFATATGRPAVRIAKACLLLPTHSAGIDPEAAYKAAADVRARDLHRRDIAWDEMTLGMAEYRRHHPDAAVDHLNTCLDLMQGAPGRAAVGFYLAMSLRELGRTEEAAGAFDRAAQAMAELPTPGEGDLGENGIENWLIAQTAQREAKAVLRPEEK
jgi:tetratricopeptide (TPR) repeat protein